MIKPGQYLVENRHDGKPPQVIYKFTEILNKRTLLFTSFKHMYYKVGSELDLPIEIVEKAINNKNYLVLDSIEEYLPPRIKTRFELIEI